MALYYKKVDAIQFDLTEEQKKAIEQRVRVYFENGPVKHIGGAQYVALLQRGEDVVKVYNGQWLVRHPDGYLQVLWPDEFQRNFCEPSQPEDFKILNDPLLKKSYNQPTTL